MRTVTGLLAAVALLLVACGVSTQDRPERISVADPPTAGQDVTPSGDGPRVTVYFVRGARLEPVQRSVGTSDLATALQLLAAGPTRREVVTGLRTAVAPQTFSVSRTSPEDPTVSIDVPPEFTSVAGGNQLLAVAQLVWTVTQFPDVDRVRVSSQGKPLEVPTDEGLTDSPVSRDDYRTVAPRGDDPSPTTTPPPGTSGTAPNPSPTAPR